MERDLSSGEERMAKEFLAAGRHFTSHVRRPTRVPSYCTFLVKNTTEHQTSNHIVAVTVLAVNRLTFSSTMRLGWRDTLKFN